MRLFSKARQLPQWISRIRILLWRAERQPLSDKVDIRHLDWSRSCWQRTWQISKVRTHPLKHHGRLLLAVIVGLWYRPSVGMFPDAPWCIAALIVDSPITLIHSRFGQFISQALFISALFGLSHNFFKSTHGIIYGSKALSVLDTTEALSFVVCPADCSILYEAWCALRTVPRSVDEHSFRLFQVSPFSPFASPLGWRLTEKHSKATACRVSFFLFFCPTSPSNAVIPKWRAILFGFTPSDRQKSSAWPSYDYYASKFNFVPKQWIHYWNNCGQSSR